MVVLGMSLVGCSQPKIGEITDVDGRTMVWTPRNQWEKIDANSLERSRKIYEELGVLGKEFSELTDKQVNHFKR